MEILAKKDDSDITVEEIYREESVSAEDVSSKNLVVNLQEKPSFLPVAPVFTRKRKSGHIKNTSVVPKPVPPSVTNVHQLELPTFSDPTQHKKRKFETDASSKLVKIQGGSFQEHADSKTIVGEVQAFNIKKIESQQKNGFPGKRTCIKWGTRNSIRSNLIRHAESAHSTHWNSLQSKSEKQLVLTSESFLKSQKDKYDAKHPAQLQFDKDVVNFIAMDSVPFTIVTGDGFRQLVNNRDKRITIRCANTYANKLENTNNTKILPKLEAFVNSFISGTLILDIWSSKRKDSVLGVKFRAIDDNFQPQTRTIGIIEFNKQHTGEAIRSEFNQLLERFSLHEKVSHVCVDSGANMLKAFCPSLFKLPLQPDIVIDIQDEKILEALQEFEELDEVKSRRSLQITPNDFDDLESVIDEDEEMFLNKLATLLQPNAVRNAINYTLKHDAELKDFCEYISSVNGFFCNRHQFANQLKEQAGRKTTRQNATRWNSFYDSCVILNQESVFHSAKGILKSALSSNVGPRGGVKNKHIPRKLKSEDKEMLEELVTFLAPFATTTDLLQGDYLTSNLLIPKLRVAFKQLAAMELKFFKKAKYLLLNEIKSRFEPVCKEPVWILSAVLDPRCKLDIFPPRAYSENLTQEQLRNTLILPSRESVKELCELYFRETLSSCTWIETVETLSETNDMYCVDEYSVHVSSTRPITEFEKYILEPRAK
ncbi:unnamed protein product, partial [Allacma fusca]